MRHIPVSGGPRTEPPVSVWPPVLLGAADSKDLLWPDSRQAPLSPGYKICRKVSWLAWSCQVGRCSKYCVDLTVQSVQYSHHCLVTS